MSTRLVAAPSRRNLLTNPGFEVNQRGLGSYTTADGANAPTLDAWYIWRTKSTATLTPITSTIGAGGTSAQLASTFAAGGQAQVYQRVPGYERLKGQPVTCACWVKANLAQSAQLYLYDGTNYAESARNLGTGAERLVLSMTLAAGATQLEAGVLLKVATCTVEVNDATLVPGLVAADYEPRSLGEELLRCQRLYERNGFGAYDIWNYGPCGSGQDVSLTVLYATTKHAIPSVTKVGAPWLISGCNEPRLENPAPDGFCIRATASVTGTCYFQTDGSANQGVTSECFP